MRVAIDAQLSVGMATGIGEYVTGLIRGLRAHGIEVEPLRAKNVDPWRFDRRVLWDQVLLPAAAARSGVDLLHCASGTMPLISRQPLVVTVHDVAWLKAQSHARAYARFYFGRFALGQYSHARQIVVDSEFSRSELLHFLDKPARINVVYPGVAEDYCNIERDRDERSFLLSVGTVERRKNLAVIIRALEKLPEEVRLIVAGPSTPYETECRALASELGVEKRIDWFGYVNRDELLSLFARAAAVVVPSTYEGFGYAAAQALCAGVPLIVSNCTSLPEVVAGDVEPLDPSDASAWCDQIEQILSDPQRAESRAQQLRAGAIARFAWRTSIAKMCEVYGAALERAS